MIVIYTHSSHTHIHTSHIHLFFQGQKRFTHIPRHGPRLCRSPAQVRHPRHHHEGLLYPQRISLLRSRVVPMIRNSVCRARRVDFGSALLLRFHGNSSNQGCSRQGNRNFNRGLSSHGLVTTHDPNNNTPASFSQCWTQFLLKTLHTYVCVCVSARTLDKSESVRPRVCACVTVCVCIRVSWNLCVCSCVCVLCVCK